MSSHAPSPSTATVAGPIRVAVIASRWNDAIVDALLAGCLARLERRDAAAVEVFRVPGAFELPVAARMMVNTNRFDAVILLGCVIRGETAHFDLVAGEAARGIQQVAVESGIPCIFGVLAVDTEQQARDRCGGVHGHAGIAAADAAVEMFALAHALKR